MNEILELALWSAMKRGLNVTVAFLACLLFLVFEDSAPEQNFRRESEHSHASFVRHPRMFLNVSPVAIKRVLDALHCAMQCLRDERCLSFNFRVKPGADNKFDCQLLATNKYSCASHLMKPTKEFDYYTVLVSCRDSRTFLSLDNDCSAAGAMHLSWTKYFTDASMACKISRSAGANQKTPACVRK